MARILFGVDTPDGPLTPQTPLPVLPPKQKGYHSVFFFEICIHLHTHQDLKLQCRRVNGQKLRYGRPCPHDLPGTHTWLAHPHIASRNSTDYLMLAQTWKLGVNCCSIGLTHHAACTQAHVPLTYRHVHRPPQFAQ